VALYDLTKKVYWNLIFFQFQSIQSPNGLIANMFGPIEGSRHNAFMLGVSGLQEKLRQLTKPDGEPYVIYGDPAYGLSYNILAPYWGNNLSDDQKVFNRDMSLLGLVSSGVLEKF
jgi:hypothetical protein